ncbi:MAG: hypothetical protein WBC04_21355 [Candidatus Acidiferrales bacterium]
MRGIDFDREAFVPSPEPTPKATPPGAGLLILLVAVGAIGIVGYKLISSSSLTADNGESRNIEQVQQQLSDIEKRIDELEKRHRGPAGDPPPVSSRVETNTPAEATRPARTIYRISAGSALKPEPEPSPRPAPSSRPAASQPVASTSPDNSANQEAWRATTDRLADVVGVVGSQQGEILQTREQLNQLLAQTQRTALQFELRRGTNRQTVGPVLLQLRDADSKKQRYSLCVYVEEKCIELKDRAVDEVVVFVVARDTAPLELVATRVGRGQIVGYLEVPREKTAP